MRSKPENKGWHSLLLLPASPSHSTPLLQSLRRKHTHHHKCHHHSYQHIHLHQCQLFCFSITTIYIWKINEKKLEWWSLIFRGNTGLFLEAALRKTFTNSLPWFQAVEEEGCQSDSDDKLEAWSSAIFLQDTGPGASCVSLAPRQQALWGHLRCCCVSPPVTSCQPLHWFSLPATKQAVSSWLQRESEVRTKQPRAKKILNTDCPVNFSIQATLRKHR